MDHKIKKQIKKQVRVELTITNGDIEEFLKIKDHEIPIGAEITGYCSECSDYGPPEIGQFQQDVPVLTILLSTEEEYEE